MAQIEKLIPHILLWENGIKTLPGETLRQTYERARAKGVIKKKTDKGGPTLAGVTLTTLQESRTKSQGSRVKVTEADLAKMSYDEWLAILKSLFWDRCNADNIRSQSVANMFVDWVWHSGPLMIRKVQDIFSLRQDGIVGPKTLAALNSAPAESVFNRLKAARERSYHRIVFNRPSQQVNLQGWLNRTNALKFEG
ncbi:MAG: peptidoglycan domain protein [Muribaculaceae bacterium]|nr:peptidoglycan domain protein [Muribaculaceae bacterium]